MLCSKYLEMPSTVPLTWATLVEGISTPCMRDRSYRALPPHDHGSTTDHVNRSTKRPSARSHARTRAIAFGEHYNIARADAGKPASQSDRPPSAPPVAAAVARSGIIYLCCVRTFLDAPRAATAPGIERTLASPNPARASPRPALVSLLYRLRAHVNVQFMYGDVWCVRWSSLAVA